MAVWMLVLLLVGIFFITKYILDKRTDSLKRLPPGPTPLPLFGNVLQMNFANLHFSFDKWQKEFGPIVSAKLFDRQLVILSSWDIIKEALVKQGDNFSARPHMWSFTYFTNGIPYGYVITDGWEWKEQRRFALHVLRDFGLGRAMLVDKIEREVIALFEAFDKEIANGDEIDISHGYEYAVVNIINNMLFGRRYDHGDSDFSKIQKAIREANDVSTKLLLPEFLPFLRPFASLFSQGLMDKIIKVFCDHFLREYETHEAEFEESVKATDFTFAFLKEMKIRGSTPEGVGSFTKEQYIYGVMDLFGAGYETTATTLTWWTLFMVHHPEIQEKMRAEIVSVVGGPPQWTDRVNLPYCQAVLAETQRHGNIAPIGMFHSVFEDTQVEGYTVPKGSFVVINHWSVMNSPELFPNPREFRPERFLQDGKFNEKVPGFLPFSMGKRQCLGEGMAKMELFILATSMVWRYAIKASGAGLPDPQGHFAFILGPKPFNVKLERIQEEK